VKRLFPERVDNNPSLYAKIPYDQAKDIAPVTLPAYAPNVLVVNPSLPANNVQELVALIKANPGKYNFASAGKGTTPSLSGELFKLSLGANDLVHVPFNGSAPAIQSTLGGHTPIAFVVLSPAVPQVKEGKLRGSYQQAVRAPNIIELFTPQFINLYNGGDPCAGPGPTASLAACLRTSRCR
jgi:tripartite-type tricarboxylate transporter receptor subunit TctC